jgi:hypothetical protein
VYDRMHAIEAPPFFPPGSHGRSERSVEPSALIDGKRIPVR